MIERSSLAKRQKLRGKESKRTTVRAIYKAIRTYPTNEGASVRDIARIIHKNEHGKTRRSLSSVKLAIARAVKNGSIRAPKGWQGFRGIDLSDKAKDKANKNKNSSAGKRGGKPKARGRPPKPGNKKGKGNVNNSTRANTSGNYSSDTGESDTTNVWFAYTCVIS